MSLANMFYLYFILLSDVRASKRNYKSQLDQGLSKVYDHVHAVIQNQLNVIEGELKCLYIEKNSILLSKEPCDNLKINELSRKISVLENKKRELQYQNPKY